MKIDFHCHHPEATDADLVIYSHANINDPIPEFVRENSILYTIGLHPWFLPNDLKSGLNEISKHFSSDYFVGLGECGLDRLRGPDLEIQKKFFSAQLELAHHSKIAFVVIHCVRTFPECQKIIMSSPFQGKFVFHDYGANLDITDQLLRDERIFFSIGRALNREVFCKETLKTIPLERILLETDDETISINSRYDQLKKVKESQIEDVLSQNLTNILQNA
ncbi:MAG: TatD family hydrolase [Bacteriovoracaceae bacterium]|nr:TatD family hydrolase [Bacteriovoracaceae bacterium]